MSWTVRISKRGSKQIERNESLQLVLRTLVADLAKNGPVPKRRWPNYSKLRGKKMEDKRHCHLIKGNPTYVCCWRVFKAEKLIEVYYVGTHEKAPY